MTSNFTDSKAMKNKFNGKGKETLFHEKEKKSGLFFIVS